MTSHFVIEKILIHEDKITNFVDRFQTLTKVMD